MIPTLLIAAPASGSGKTTVTCALAAALRARGLDVRLFKAGPDYLDPTWHQAVSGRPSRNLDGWMTGRSGVEAAFARGAAGGDIALVEGMMGLFDGHSPTTLEGSGAQVAQWLGIPTVVVVDASAMARTAAAVVAGLAGYEPSVPVVGVIFNRVGGPGHAGLLAEAMKTVPSVRCLGALASRNELAVPERHLGLVSAELVARPGWVEEMAEWGRSLDLDALLALARVPTVEAPARRVAPARTRIGLALDAAFHFYYPDNLDLLREAGAELVPFSPLADAALPPDLGGLYIGGGYPESHREALEANTAMRAAIRAFPGCIYAECGGLMYLGARLASEGGDASAMCGVLPLRTRMTPRLRALGYREVTTTVDTPLGPAGICFRGHEFHYSELEEVPALSPVYRVAGAGAPEGWLGGKVLGSYVHAHFGSNPQLAANLVAACALRGGEAPSEG